MIVNILLIFSCYEIVQTLSPAPRCPHKARGSQSTPSPARVTNTPGTPEYQVSGEMERQATVFCLWRKVLMAVISRVSLDNTGVSMLLCIKLFFGRLESLTHKKISSTSPIPSPKSGPSLKSHIQSRKWTGVDIIILGGPHPPPSHIKRKLSPLSARIKSHLSQRLDPIDSKSS